MKYSREMLWIVVAVESGIPVVVKGFRSKDRADELALKLRKDSNPEDDEVAIFRIGISHGK
jgi:hypothetical protein